MGKHINIDIELPDGFSAKLSEYFEWYSTTDIHTVPRDKQESYVRFKHNDWYKSDIPKFESPINSGKQQKYEIDDMRIVDAVYEPKLGAPDSFFIAVDKSVRVGKTSLGVALLYELDGEIHCWYPTFEELFLPLICFDREHATNDNLQAVQETFARLDTDLNVYEITEKHGLDCAIQRLTFGSDTYFPAVVYHILIKQIMLIEQQKYKHNPNARGPQKPLDAFRDLYRIKDPDDDEAIFQWRQRNILKDPWT